ncbi:hypothetical protein GRI62_10155 [Erythrobacter arachoides]|uniref:Uncharacterized protein n=1 Tax=Aurantiacibacter arachoides TaxID=1850444 RepID=A0A845A3G1_9SPHN|nr:hypothetical protein [Aurantiacibacter arachoides]MXO93962.1 hypothetical protein [Aurantiacibacter arachoides]GGD45233.1 hypothetical protein GCM10011411_01060 [Aurantiacibacter arachoides]
MNHRLAGYIWPGVAGAVVTFVVRYVMGDLSVALIGIVVFAVIYAILIVLSRTMRWADAPMVYAGTAAAAASIAFIVSHSS